MSRPGARSLSSVPPRAAVNSASWVTDTTAVPASSSSERKDASSAQVHASWPKVGSSRTSTFGMRCEDGGHGQPPLLPAGERVRVGIHEVRQPQPLQQFLHPVLAVAEMPGAEHEFIQHPAGDELVLGLLEHRPDPRNQLFGLPAVRVGSGAGAEVRRGGDRSRRPAAAVRPGSAQKSTSPSRSGR